MVAQEKVFTEICYGKLNLDEQTAQQGLELWRTIIALRLHPEENTSELVWVACALFLASVRQIYGAEEGKETLGNGLKLAQLLGATSVSMVQFFEHLALLQEKLPLGPTVKDSTLHMKENFISASLLYKKYQKLWIKCRTVRGDPSSASDRSLIDRLFDFGWLLFVTSKNISQVEPNIPSSYRVLVGSMCYALLYLPPASRSSSSDPPPIEIDVAAALTAMGSPQRGTADTQKRGREGERKMSHMELLCKETKLSETEIQQGLLVVLKAIAVLREQGILKSPDPLSLGQEEGEGEKEDSSFDREAQRVLHLLGVSESSQASSTSSPFMFLTEDMSRLYSHYELAFLHKINVIDERFFMNRDLARNIGTPSKLSSSARPFPPTPKSASRKLFQEGDGSPQSPQKRFPEHSWNWQGKVPPRSPFPPRSPSKPFHTPQRLGASPRSPSLLQTPVSAAMEANKWMRNLLEEDFQGPTLRLTEFFSSCSGPNPSEAIEERLQKMAEKITLSHASSSSSWRKPSSVKGLDFSSATEVVDRGTERTGERGKLQSEAASGITKTRVLAVRLYYRVLEEMLSREEERLKTKDFGNLLHNEVFHRALFACSVEVALKSNSLVTLCFPKILELFSISAFDLSKVIESFVRHAPKLPSLLKRRMNEIEEIILESSAWAANSPLWSILREQYQREKEKEKEEQEKTKKGGIMKTENGAADSKKGPDATTSAPAKKKSSVLDLFFRKVLSLSASRIYELCKGLDLRRDLYDQVWTAVKWILSDHIELLQNRHLDQIILCSIYGVAKVNKVKPEVTFKGILEVYKQMPHHSTKVSVIRDIILHDGTRGDIVKFYNKVYIPEVKMFLLQFQQQALQQQAADNVAKEGGATGSSGTIVKDIVKTANETAAAAVAATSSAPPAGPFGRKLIPMSPKIQQLPLPLHVKSPQRVLASNVYLSPRRPITDSPLTKMTPRTRGLYAFGESPSRDLALINRAVNSHKRSAPVLSFDDDENDALQRKRRHIAAINGRKSGVVERQ